MFGKILGKNKKESEQDIDTQVIIEKISKMNLVDMRVYVNDKLKDFEVCEDGLNEVMRRLISKSTQEKRYIESDAMDSKKKKAFDLVILVSKNKKVTIVTTELIQEFIKLYNDIIIKFDADNKQIYESKLKDSINSTIATITSKAEIDRKNKVLGN